ncbi:acyl--CoA ligase [Salicibibacter cibi]|uniref:Acyl--CoA ligase n=1 Tax=Salicibibacter cibi TaxID=2743001 RepID=A0A7T7CE52_9BACI|nr:class I adenylate-forming enzyme family protein [Salicibibacter cibi]QQK78693.1 acyl--CoA ligase [Salicibibacter cibi]
MEKPTVAHMLENAVSAVPDSVFLHEGPKNVTFRELDNVTDQLATAFIKDGLRKGDKLGIIALNQLEWLYTYFAAMKIGVGVVALNVRYRAAEFEYMLNQSEVKAIVSLNELGDFSYSDFFEGFKNKIPSVEHYIFMGEGFNGSRSFVKMLDEPAANQLLNEAKARVRPTDTALVIYTSGTTGKPKGAMISHNSVIASAKAQMDHFGIMEEDVTIGSMPLNHVGGISCCVTVVLLSHSSVVLVPAFDPDEVLEAIHHHKATIFGGVPTMYRMLLNNDKRKVYRLDSLRLCFAGGSNVEPELCELITGALPNARLSNLYGLSETSGACVLSKSTDDIEKVQASIGVAIGDFDIKVVSEEKKTLFNGEIGELAVKGACVAKGYDNMIDETKESFGHKGWLYTGDMAYMDDEGYIYYKGRKKEMIVQGGYNVYPVEVENILVEHPEVSMAAGFGVPDDFLGEVGRFYIVLAPGARLSEEELKNYCAGVMADYKIPRQFVFVDDVPLTPAGKIQKSLLKEQYFASLQ